VIRQNSAVSNVQGGAQHSSNFKLKTVEHDASLGGSPDSKASQRRGRSLGDEPNSSLPNANDVERVGSISKPRGLKDQQRSPSYTKNQMKNGMSP